MPATNGFQFIEGDSNILQYVYELRLAHIDHLTALTGRSHKAIARRLLKLQERRYLACIKRRPQKHLYALGSEGASVLIEEGHAPAELARKRLRHRELSEISIKHTLFTVDIHTKILILTRNSPIRLLNWEEGPRLWDQVTTRDADGREATIPVRPDAWFTLQHTERPEGKNRLHFFLEADRASMAHSRMESKIRGYLAYYQQGRHTQKYAGMKFFRVATIAETHLRAQRLDADLQGIIPAQSRKLYRFVAFEDLTIDSLMSPASAQVT